MAHWDNENFNTEVPPENILCRNCKFKMPPVEVAGREVDRSGYGSCKKYSVKPQEILWNGAYCPMYRKESR